MTVILLLSHDLDAAKTWVLQQDLENPFLLDEREVVKENPNRFYNGFCDIKYSSNLVDYMRIKRMTWRSHRPLVILMDMRHQSATATIAHDTSVLYYDGSHDRRLQYNILYEVDFIISDASIKLMIGDKYAQ
jgi:hypothetical protein